VWLVLPVSFFLIAFALGRDVLCRPIEVSGIERGPKSDAL
jgi:hypothetical protein